MLCLNQRLFACSYQEFILECAPLHPFYAFTTYRTRGGLHHRDVPGRLAHILADASGFKLDQADAGAAQTYAILLASTDAAVMHG